MKKPNLFIIGAPKCATTSIYYYLKEHNEVFVPDIKEQHFFSQPKVKDTYYDVYFANTLNEYLQNYNNVKNERVIADISPSYLYYEDAADKIINFNNNSKVIVVLRDPIDRAISHYLMDLKMGYANKPLSFYLKDSKTYYYKEYVGNSLYYEKIKHYKEVFKENLLILFFDELNKKPELTMDKVFDFLNIEKIKIDFSEKHNSYSKARSPILFYLRKLHLYNIIEKIIPHSLRKKLKRCLFTDNIEKPDFSNERRILSTIFKENTEKLNNFLNKEDY